MATLAPAESWEKVYKAFETINFTAYDYDAVKQSLIDYLKFYYPENFNDYIDSSQMIALCSMFAYVCELMAYRADFNAHERDINSAQRKQSILSLVKLISYKVSRNIPLRGLVKITSITTSEDVRDSQANSLTNRVIRWNDPNNVLWKEQFHTIMNRVLKQPFGSPSKSFQLDSTIFQQYQFQNVLETTTERSSFRNGVLKYKIPINGADIDFELVPADIDTNGVFERTPNRFGFFTLLFLDDGFGDSSDTTGYMMYTKQGTLQRLTYVFDAKLPNRALDLNLPGVNDSDVWVQRVDSRGEVLEEWENAPSVSGSNLVFNTAAGRKKFEIETLENDEVRLLFGDGDFSEIPTGIFNMWVRQSASGTMSVPKTQLTNGSATFLYTSKLGRQESCTITYQLTGALQNSAPAEDIEHIRSAAPGVYYSQNRMVNGEDYNSFPMKDSSILRLKSVNRTFSGESKTINVNDASGRYQNVKLFGNDLRLFYDVTPESRISQISSRSMIDEVIEPLLGEAGLANLIAYSFYISADPLNVAFARPRTRLIEDLSLKIDGIPILEKTEIQGMLDRHWYGEPDSTVNLDVNLSETGTNPKSPHAIVNNDTDKLIYDSNLKMVTKNAETGVYTLINTPNNASGLQVVARQKRFGIAFDPDRPFTSLLRINPANTTTVPNSDNLSSADIEQTTAVAEVWTVEVTDTDGTFSVYGSISGVQASGKIKESYSNGKISFIIDFPEDADDNVVVGDAFIIVVVSNNGLLSPTVHKKNLHGRFYTLDDSLISIDPTVDVFDPNEISKSWVMIIDRTDDVDGNLQYWTITTRNFKLTAYSPTTQFFYEKSDPVIDPDTKIRVQDSIRILKSNLTASRTTAIGVDHVYSVVSDVHFSDGEINGNALAVTSADSTQVLFSGNGGVQNPDFLRFFSNTDYVYFLTDVTTGRLLPVTRTDFIANLLYVNDISGSYVRKRGRDLLDFMWQHFAKNDHPIDPTPTNVIDMYVLTRGYYSQILSYVRGLTDVEPLAPTSLELRNTYRSLLASKTISDTIVMHSGKIKYLFGSKAKPELRAKFKIVMRKSSKLTGNQVRARVLDVINDYFSVEDWNFGDSFYATKLQAAIDKELPNDVASAVLVPVFPTNYFGDLYYLTSAPDEIFASCATVDDIEIVEGLDRVTLKQKV